MKQSSFSNIPNVSLRNLLTQADDLFLDSSFKMGLFNDSIIISVDSGSVPPLFWQVMFILTSLKQHSTTHIRPPGLAGLSLMECGDGLIIS